MENYSYSSYPDSGDSSPRSREIDCENPSWDETLPNYKVKFMCSYGGKIQPRSHDNQLAYVGGDTKILAVDRTIRFSGIVSKLSSLCDSDVCFKYQLPGEDLDALISVTNDEDLEHMMLEYDRLHRATAKPARLRLFLFSLNSSAPTSFGSNEPKNERQWFVDVLNSVPIQSPDASSPPTAVAPSNPDFLFGLDKGQAAPPAAKLQDPTPESAAPEVPPVEIPAGSDSGKEDRGIGTEPIVDPVDIQRQIQELQRLQIASQEQAMLQRKSDDNLARPYPGDYYVPKIQEKTPPVPSPVPMTAPVSLPTAYWQERHMTTGGYPATAAATGQEQPVYLIPAQAGMYQTPTSRPVTGQVGQGYYQMQRMVQDVYREPPMYNVVPPPLQQQKVGAYPEGVGMVRAAGGGMGLAEAGYTQMAYDSAGRQVYYTTAPGGMVPPYQTVTAASVDGRQTGALNQEGKVSKTSQASV
ncbi:hypothetical protein HHK36_032542 [Tetracentron sinense]|uniref:PB1 domain-containing protein n=1 Tax=Tetracentron sinense TaxID=13715 RepID=A0A834Y907_TETSI|nr:hypothetical protein HHK36_032542 [Tetracentron sinense]